MFFRVSIVMNQLVIFLFLLLSNIGFSQNDKIRILDEIWIEPNISVNSNDKLESRPGFGVFVYHTFETDYNVECNLGLGYNLIRVFSTNYSETKYDSYFNSTHSRHSISIPFNLRFSKKFEKASFFLEPGISLEPSFYCSSSGSKSALNSTIVQENWTPKFQYSSLINIGLNMGIGYARKINKGELIFKIKHQTLVFPLRNSQDFSDITGNNLALGIGYRF